MHHRRNYMFSIALGYCISRVARPEKNTLAYRRRAKISTDTLRSRSLMYHRSANNCKIQCRQQLRGGRFYFVCETKGRRHSRFVSSAHRDTALSKPLIPRCLLFNNDATQIDLFVDRNDHVDRKICAFISKIYVPSSFRRMRNMAESVCRVTRLIYVTCGSKIRWIERDLIAICSIELYIPDRRIHSNPKLF